MFIWYLFCGLKTIQTLKMFRNILHFFSRVWHILFNRKLKINSPTYLTMSEIFFLIYNWNMLMWSIKHLMWPTKMYSLSIAWKKWGKNSTEQIMLPIRLLCLLSQYTNSFVRRNSYLHLYQHTHKHKFTHLMYCW